MTASTAAAHPDGNQTPADVGHAGLGDSLENRHGAAKSAPSDVRLAGDAAPKGNLGGLSLKAYPDMMSGWLGSAHQKAGKLG